MASSLNKCCLLLLAFSTSWSILARMKENFLPFDRIIFASFKSSAVNRSLAKIIEVGMERIQLHISSLKYFSRSPLNTAALLSLVSSKTWLWGCWDARNISVLKCSLFVIDLCGIFTNVIKSSYAVKKTRLSSSGHTTYGKVYVLRCFPSGQVCLLRIHNFGNSILLHEMCMLFSSDHLPPSATRSKCLKQIDITSWSQMSTEETRWCATDTAFDFSSKVQRL